jgi:phosphoglycerate dehydrogenase-like enzyme
MKAGCVDTTPVLQAVMVQDANVLPAELVIYDDKADEGVSAKRIKDAEILLVERSMISAGLLRQAERLRVIIFPGGGVALVDDLRDGIIGHSGLDTFSGDSLEFGDPLTRRPNAMLIHTRPR